MFLQGVLLPSHHVAEHQVKYQIGRKTATAVRSAANVP
jgi:hypothetical protein